VTEISEKAQKKVQKAVEEYPKIWTHGICALQMFDRKSGEESGGGKTGYMCHAPLNHPVRNDLIVVNAHKYEWHQSNPEYLKWVARESPFSHGVLNKDNEKELFEHASVFDMETIGKGGCLWLGKAFRYFVEDTWKPGYWDKLREAGLDGLQAFIGASILDQEGAPMGYSHVNLVGYQNPKDLRATYDRLKKIKDLKTTDAGIGMYAKYKNWGGLGFTVVRKPDGWGGYIEVKKPCDAKEYAEKLREIFEGDPKNVK